MNTIENGCQTEPDFQAFSIDNLREFLKKYYRQGVENEERDLGHSWSHINFVETKAVEILIEKLQKEKEKIPDEIKEREKEIVIVAALLHDFVRNKEIPAYEHSIVSAKHSLPIIKEFFPPGIDRYRVYNAILKHSAHYLESLCPNIPFDKNPSLDLSDRDNRRVEIALRMADSLERFIPDREILRRTLRVFQRYRDDFKGPVVSQDNTGQWQINPVFKSAYLNYWNSKIGDNGQDDLYLKSPEGELLTKFYPESEGNLAFMKQYIKDIENEDNAKKALDFLKSVIENIQQGYDYDTILENTKSYFPSFASYSSL